MKARGCVLFALPSLEVFAKVPHGRRLLVEKAEGDVLAFPEMSSLDEVRSGIPRTTDSSS